MQKSKFLISVIIIISFSTYSQNYYKTNQKDPKLVVGIVVDQMRYDYIHRFWNEFGNGGFKKLINEGFFCRNAKFGYMPTFTGPGHASIFTGTTPSVHGIIANNWYDKHSNQLVYCAGDGTRHTVCNCEHQTTDIISSEGQMSPHHMLTTTIGDEIKLFNSDNIVIGLSLKDRGAILSAGHSADAAYWMDKNGDWITSSYYMNDLPEWLISYQQRVNVTDYLQGNWENKNFSHNLNTLLSQKGGGSIKTTPLGNTILKDLAIEVISSENMGKDNNLDFLTVSFSSTDYIGHKYGPHSEEIKDTYIKLDEDISQFLIFLEQKVGKNNLLVFITADHGVVSEPKELSERNIPSGYYNANNMIKDLEDYLKEYFNLPEKIEIISNYSNNQIFLNHDFVLENSDIALEHIQDLCAKFILNYEWVKNTYTADQLFKHEYNNSHHSLIQQGFNQKRSGDVVIAVQSGWLSSGWESGGTSHGSSYSYDTHVPLIFWGGLIKPGILDRRVNIRDIAPTICLLLGVAHPNGCTGEPIMEITND